MAVLCLGCGLLLEALSGARLPRPLLLPAGLALVVVLAQLAISTSATIPLATPAVAAAAALGLVFGRPWRLNPAGAGPGIAGAACVYAAFAAPIVLSGNATFAGYIKLDDTATWFALTDHAMAHGRSLAHLPVSTYGATIASYIGTGYPLGSFLPLGVAHRLLRQDVAWLFQPYMAFLAAMLALCLYWLARRVALSRALAAAAAFGGAQAATLYGYYLWGGLKEVAGAWLVALTAALAADVARGARLGRAVLPVAVASAAGLSVLSIGAVVWLAPPLLGALILAWPRQRPRVALRQALTFVPVAAALSLPAITTASSFLAPGTGTLTASTELGNLRRPLEDAQALGIWPAGDFRGPAVSAAATDLLVTALIACVLLALVAAWRRHAWELPLFVVGIAVSTIVVGIYGSPWVEGKAFATASPAFVLGGVVGAVLLFRQLPPLGALLGAAILGGVLWSNALAYRDADLAPRPQLRELELIGQRFAGRGPALLNDYEPYGARHFLRSLDAESVSELRRHVIPLRGGAQVPKGASADLDRFPISSLLPYRTIVLHRSPIESRPPAPYALVWRGRYWDVWQRPLRGNAAIVADLPIGAGFEPGAVPNCASVLRLATVVPPGGSLAAVRRTRPVVLDFTRATSIPAGWAPDPAHLGSLEPTGAGTLGGDVVLPRSARYAIWLGGTFKSRVRVYIDGRLVASARNVLQWEPFVQIGAARLSGGLAHEVRVVYDGASLLHPGSGGFETGLGPLVFSDETGHQSVTYVPPSRARSLCGSYLDWLEALGPRR